MKEGEEDYAKGLRRGSWGDRCPLPGERDGGMMEKEKGKRKRMNKVPGTATELTVLRTNNNY